MIQKMAPPQNFPKMRTIELGPHLRYLLFIAGVVAFVSTSVYFAFTWRWPLVGDASLIHYICFLMDHGMAPYRDSGDMNMPGAFLLEWCVMHVLGEGALAWRIYDFLLMGTASAAIVSITRSCGWFPGILGSAIFILVHGRDGLAQGGQRDLSMAVFLLIATALLFRAVRQVEPWAAGIFGLLAGFAVTIKPTAVLFALGLLGMAVATLIKRGQPYRGALTCSSLALLVGPMIVLVFLLRERALGAFLLGLRTVVPYYASLGHRPLGFLLIHSISPLMPLVVVWLILLAVARPRLSWERAALFTGVVFGLASYVIQARGLPYYRYPLLAFLVSLISLDLAACLMSARAKVSKVVAIAGIVLGAFLIVPVSAWMILRYDWRNLDFITSLEANLDRFGGSQLSGHIQCVDSISGCGTTLYRMKLVQATGVLSDFLLFGPPEKPVIRQTRERFSEEIQEKNPTVIVVSSFLHIDGPDGYAKLDRWPEFRDYLFTHYCQAVEWAPTRPQRWWSRAQWPNGYRVYLLRGSSVASQCEHPKGYLQ
jgi:hypothetical protein